MSSSKTISIAPILFEFYCLDTIPMISFKIHKKHNSTDVSGRFSSCGDPNPMLVGGKKGGIIPGNGGIGGMPGGKKGGIPAGIPAAGAAVIALFTSGVGIMGGIRGGIITENNHTGYNNTIDSAG